MGKSRVVTMKGRYQSVMATCPNCEETRWGHAMGHQNMCTACCMRRGGCGRHPAVGRSYADSLPLSGLGLLPAPTIAGVSPSSSSSSPGA